MRRRGLAGATLVLVLALAACGDAPEQGTGARDAPPGADASGPLVIVRTGGLAGVEDTLRVDADGRARLTDRRGASRACRPDPAAVRRLREVDLDAVPSPGGPPAVADGFTYTVSRGTARASVTEGDVDGRRVELLDAAAAVLASC